jgi:hypothetical protein
MCKTSIIPALLCLSFCSCQRVVWTANPVIENADNADLSLAGVWTRYKRPVVDELAADQTVEVSFIENARSSPPLGDMADIDLASRFR